MPINSEHPQFTSHKSQWAKCRVAVEGEDAVKAGGKLYLPELHGMDLDVNKDYTLRANFFGASNRTVMGLTGAVTRKPAQVEWPESKMDLLSHIGREGDTLDAIAGYSLEEVLTTGRCGLLVDAPEGEGEPYIVFYYPENIINWDSEMGKDATGQIRERITRVILTEEVLAAEPADPYKKIPETRYREMYLDDDGYLVVSIWKMRGNDRVAIASPLLSTGSGGQGGDWRADWVKAVDDAYPTFRGGKRLNFIPFKFISPSGTTSEVEKSPILDLVNVNLGHYRNSADLEHGLHFTALPTAWVSGYDGDEELNLGSTTAWVTENENARAGFIEFTGNGLKAIDTEMDKKEKKMAVLGARLLEETKVAAEAAETVALRQQGESSVLAKVAEAVSDGVTWALQVVAQWTLYAKPADVKYTLNRRFSIKSLTALDVTALMAAMQGGAISFDVFYYNLERGEMYPDGHTMETERDLIEKGLPSFTPEGGDITLPGKTPPAPTNTPPGKKGSENIPGNSPAPTTGAAA